MSIQYPQSLIAVGGARTGIAPVNLLDVQDVNGNIYYWADRPILAPAAIVSGAIVPAGVSAPVTLSAGQGMAWALPTSSSASGLQTAAGYLGQPQPSPYTSDAVANAAGGSLYLTGSSSTGLNIAWCKWAGFQMPSLPAGAVIEAIYPVVVTQGFAQNCLHNLNAGLGSTQTEGNAFEEGSASGIAYAGQFHSESLGNTSADVATAYVQVSIWQTLGGSGYPDQMSVSFAGLAIYYALPTASAQGSGSGAPYSSNPEVPGYAPWLLSVPSFTFHRSLQTDVGSFVLQNLSGDTLSRDFEKIMRKSALEGAIFVWRLWQPDAQAAWLEVHGTLSVSEVGVDTVQLAGAQLLNPSQDDTPLEVYCETCQLQWGGARCGSTEATECSYSYQTCQRVERIMVVTNNYEINFGETLANVSQQIINRARRL